MSDGPHAFDPNYGWEPSIPLPYYKRRWFRWICVCDAFTDKGRCPAEFNTETAYQSHYLREHR